MKPGLKKTIAWTLKAIAVAILLFLVIYGWDEIIEQFKTMNWWYALGALLSTGGVLYFHAIRWFFLLKVIDSSRTPSVWTCCNYVIMSRYASLILPQALGMAGGRIGALKLKNNWQISKATLSVICELFLDMLFAMLMLGASIMYFVSNYNNSLYTVMICTTIILFVFCLFIARLPLIERILQKIMAISFIHKIFKKKYPSFQPEEISIIEKISISFLLILAILTIIRFGFLALRSYLIACAVGFTAQLVLFFVAVPIAQFAIILSVLPEGIGFLEGGWFAVFSSVGYAKEEIAAFLISHRIILTMIIVAITFLHTIVNKVVRHHR